MTTQLLAHAFSDAMLDAWQDRGADSIARLRQSDPVAYLRLVANVAKRNLSEAIEETEDPADLDAVLRFLEEASRPNAAERGS